MAASKEDCWKGLPFKRLLLYIISPIIHVMNCNDICFFLCRVRSAENYRRLPSRHIVRPGRPKLQSTLFFTITESLSSVGHR